MHFIFPSQETLSGGKNPGSLISEQQTEGRVIVGLGTNKNQNSFCVFEDGSAISCDVLLRQALRE